MAGSGFDLTGSRLQNSTRVNQAAEDADVIDWVIGDDFIFCAMVEVTGHGGATGTLQLRWRNVTDAGTFAVLSSTGELNWTATTDLVNGNAVTSGEAVCTPIDATTYADGVEREGANDVSTTLSQNEYTEHQWAIDGASLLAGKQYEFEIYDASAGATLGTCLAQITIAAVVANISADQTEAGDTQAVSVTSLIQIAADQTEAGDTQAVSFAGVTVATITVDQTETGDTQAVTVTSLVQISVDQTETGDTQAVSVTSLIQIAADQLEEDDTQAITVTSLVQISADQAETGDTQAVSVTSLIQIAIDQTEAGDTQAVSFTEVTTASISADQIEAGDTQAASFTSLIQIAVDQIEAGDIQAVSIAFLIQISADQVEEGDTQAVFFGEVKTFLDIVLERQIIEYNLVQSDVNKIKLAIGTIPIILMRVEND